eukprot:6193510-Pleurochrysis_carterae.AAC.1
MGELDENSALREWVLLNIIRADLGNAVPMLVSQVLGLADSCGGTNVMETILAAPFVGCAVVRTADGWWEIRCESVPALSKRYTCDEDVANHLINHIARDYLRRPSAAEFLLKPTTQKSDKGVELVSAIAPAAARAAALCSASKLYDPATEHHRSSSAADKAARKKQALEVHASKELCTSQAAFPVVGQRCVLDSRSASSDGTTIGLFKVDEKAATVSIAFDDCSWECINCPDSKFPGSVLADAEDATGVYFVLRSRLGQKLPEAYLKGPAAQHF